MSVTDTGLQDVTVTHRGGTAALRGVTIDIADGELLVVLGPSGSGKSTLLRALAGLTPVTSGRVFVRGKDVTRVAPRRRNVAMVFESDALVPFLDVAQNMQWGLRARKVPRPEADGRVSAQAQGLRLEGLLGRLPPTLSAGERGMTGIGRALVQRPDVFLLDEPLAHLDAAERGRVRRQIVTVVSELRITTVYSTHDQHDAMAMADRIAVLRAGEIVQLDTPRRLYRRPVDLFVAEFLGSPPLGLLRAQLVASQGSAGFQVGTRVLPRWAPVPAELGERVGAEVLLGIRAEDVRDAALGSEPQGVTLPAIVTGVERRNRDVVVTATAEAAGELRSVFAGRSAVQPGDAVELAVDATRAHVFDPDTGVALWHPQD